jgi:hypothetical protein
MPAPTPLRTEPFPRAFEDALRRALDGDDDRLERLVDVAPADERDALITLLRIHDLHLAPIETLEGLEQFQHHPAVAALKRRLESQLVAALDARVQTTGDVDGAAFDVAKAVRRVAAANLTPPAYEWLADDADYDELVEFLAIEGGPDGGFDDLVAVAQLGLHGQAKLTLAKNYWDEMGRGSLDDIHTELHHRLTRAVDLPRIPRDQLPTEALRRSAVNGLLATNRALQPEMLGALGVLEVQAGPRCRKVLAALERLDAPADTIPFYAEHAQTDPRHGKEWIDEALVPLVEQRPEWGRRIVRGAAWRCAVNDDLFAVLHDRYAGRRELARSA